MNKKQNLKSSIYKVVADAICNTQTKIECPYNKAYKKGMLTPLEYIELIENL